MDKYSLEHHFKIYNNATGSYLKIGPDKDGLGMVEISHSENDFSILLLDPEEAKYLVDAVNQIIPELQNLYNKNGRV